MKDKIIHLSTSDIRGGSAYYAYRIHKFLSKIRNVDSKMYVLNKFSKDKKVKTFKYESNSKFLNKINFFFLTKRNKYSFYNFGKYVINQKSQINNIIAQNPNKIILYNNSNFIHPKILEEFVKKKIKLFFYLTDMEMITGGCHYNFECKNFKNNCRNCPATRLLLNKTAQRNLSLKKQYLYNKKITFLVPNKKIHNDLIFSSIFNSKKHKVLKFYLSLDLKKYTLKKSKLKKKIVFSFRSSLNPRKGLKYLIKAVNKLLSVNSTITKFIHFNILGNSSILSFLDNKKISYNFYSSINNEKKLIKFYQESDFFINQSIQDVGPTMVSESLACGIPVISFDTGMSKDLIKNNRNGYLVKTKSSTHLAKILEKSIFINKKKLLQMKKNSRKSAEQYLNLTKATQNLLNNLND